MVSLLLFVIGCYVLTALSVHLCYRICQHQQMEKHYVLLAEQPVEKMEWIIRSMHSFSKWMGIPIQVTIIPTTYSSELSYMAERWSDQCFPIQIQQQAKLHAFSPAHTIIVDLDKEHDLCKLPF